MKGNTPSSSNISQQPRGFGISNGHCCGPPLLEYAEWHVEKNTIQIFQNCTFYRFLCMISFVLHVCGVLGRQELFSLSIEETDLEGLIKDSHGR